MARAIQSYYLEHWLLICTIRTVQNAEVLVIGAGAAGLAAAGALIDAGTDVLILEARGRIGGRVYTRYEATGPVELGAEFVHARPPEIAGIAPQLELDEVRGEEWMFDDGVLRPCDDLWPQVDRIFDSLEMRGRPDESFDEFVQSSFPGHAWRPARAWSEAYVEGFNAARKERISVRALARDERAAKAIGGDRAFRFKDGYSRLIEVLSSTIPADRIRTHNDVRTIFWRRHHVEVEASGQSYRARQAVITLPLSILQDSAGVRFIPEITDKRAAAGELQMGQVTRLVMRFKEPFWRPGMSFLYSPSEVFTAWWTNLPIDGHKLTGWTAGVRPEFLNAQGPTWVVHQALGSLSRIFALDIAELKTLLDEIHYHDWQTDPFTCGAYSYIPVGSIEVPAYLARPVDDTLFFAGEATDSAGRGGTVDGAIASGRRAAGEALGAAAESGRPARL